jgi:replication factor A1
MRTYNSKQGEGNLFNLELIDEDGTRIEATLWRDVATKYFDKVEEGKVYYVSKAGLKPANKTYSSIPNDYQLLISDRTEIEECKDASAEQLQNVKAKLNITKIANLPQHLNKSRVLLDVVGVVANVAPVGSVKRKSDNSEVTRRDLTIFDSSGRSVQVTMWAALATTEGETLDKLQNENPIIALSGVRANDYNGCSLSTVSRSTLLIDPSETEVPEVAELKEWLSSQAGKTDFPHCGEGLTTGRSSLGGGSRVRVTLQELREKPVPAVGAKEYFNTWAYISNIQPDQTLYYMAAPDGSNKKVVQEGEKYYCEGTQTTHDTFIRRYVMRSEVMDHTGKLIFNVFNDQAETLLGCTADEIAENKEKGDPLYDLTLKNALLVPYSFRVMCKAEEYNNEVRVRYAVSRCSKVNFVEESTRLVTQINELLKV